MINNRDVVPKKIRNICAAFGLFAGFGAYLAKIFAAHGRDDAYAQFAIAEGVGLACGTVGYCLGSIHDWCRAKRVAARQQPLLDIEDGWQSLNEEPELPHAYVLEMSRQ
jgi:hypothetical protein